MECIKCGRELAEEAAFCPYCGKEIASKNPKEETPTYFADIKGLLKSGKLAVYNDRVEYIANNVQKTIFYYSGLISVKKGTDRILFITEDGHTEPCILNNEIIDDAFSHIEKAATPYIIEKTDLLFSKGIKCLLVTSLTPGSGILNVLNDRAEFKATLGRNETICFKDVKSVCLSKGMLEFTLSDKKTKSFILGKNIREAFLSFTKRKFQFYISERKKALLSKGIYYSFFSSQGSDSGTLNIFKDRIEFSDSLGKNNITLFKHVRTVRFIKEKLEFLLTRGTSKFFTVDKDIQDEVLSFLTNAIQPYVIERITGFEISFGTDERIEINQKRGVFHIIRQEGNEITDEYPLYQITKCEQIEYGGLSNILEDVVFTGKTVINNAAEAVGLVNTAAKNKKISYIGIILTIQTEQGTQIEKVQFSNSFLKANQINKKYDKYIAEITKFMNYLANNCPNCELLSPSFPKLDDNSSISPSTAADKEKEDSKNTDISEKNEHSEIIKRINAISELIGEYKTPMTIAIQGNWIGDKSSIMAMLSDNLKQYYECIPINFNTWHFSQFDSGKQLPILVGSKFINQLGDLNNLALKNRALKAARGLINIVSGYLSNGKTDGQELADALFANDFSNSFEGVIEIFSDLIEKRAFGENDRVIFLVEGLNELEPLKEVEILDVMKYFFRCKKSMFVIAAEYDSIRRGVEEKYNQDYDERRTKNFFNSIFQASFRVSVSHSEIQSYIKKQLENIEVYTSTPEELETYVELVQHSVGCDSQKMDLPFNSFPILKKMDDKKLYSSADRKLMLFALCCMQIKYHDIYDFIVRMKDNITPNFMGKLCSNQPEILASLPLNDNEKTEFYSFAKILYDIVTSNNKEGISESDCKIFTEVLDFFRCYL